MWCNIKLCGQLLDSRSCLQSDPCSFLLSCLFKHHLNAPSELCGSVQIVWNIFLTLSCQPCCTCQGGTNYTIFSLVRGVCWPHIMLRIVEVQLHPDKWGHQRGCAGPPGDIDQILKYLSVINAPIYLLLFQMARSIWGLTMWWFSPVHRTALCTVEGSSRDYQASALYSSDALVSLNPAAAEGWLLTLRCPQQAQQHFCLIFQSTWCDRPSLRLVKYWKSGFSQRKAIPSSGSGSVCCGIWPLDVNASTLQDSVTGICTAVHFLPLFSF